MRAVNFLLTLLAVIYPFFLFFVEGVGRGYLFLAFALLWFIKATIIAFFEDIKAEESKERANSSNIYLNLFRGYFSLLDDFKLSLTLSIIFFVLFFNISLPIAFIYPTLINIFIFFIFFIGINKKPLIQQLAEIEHTLRGLPPLNNRQIEYTKNLNYIWCFLFATNAIITFILSLEEDKVLWTVYSGILVYIFSTILFLGDRVYRKIRRI